MEPTMIDYAMREAALCRDYQSGLNSPELAKRYGITPQRVRQILMPHGVIAERNKQREEKRMQREAAKRAYWYELEQRCQHAVEMVENGVSISKACRATKVSYTAVRSALDDRGVKSVHSRWRDETGLRRRIAELIAQGLSPRKIKKVLDNEKLRVSVHWIYDNFGPELRAQKLNPPTPANDNNPAQEQKEAA